MKTLEEFQQHYETTLRPVLEEMEARRVGIRNKFLTVVGVVAAALAAAVALLASQAPSAAPVCVIVLILGVAAIGIAWYFLTKDYVLEFKRRVVGEIVRFCDPSLRYEPQRCIPQQQFRDSHLFLHGIDRYKGEDYVAGRIGRTAVEFSEIHAEYKTTTRDSKGHTRTQWHTIFKGLFFIADFNKDFQGRTIVLPDVAEKVLGGFLGKMFQGINITRSEKLVKLEDPVFEKEFVVYGDDQIEARYILSTSLMSRITEFKRKTGKPLCLSFVRSNVHVGVTTGKNMFEPRIFRTVLDFDLAREYLRDLELTLGIVEELNLNTRIWTKR